MVFGPAHALHALAVGGAAPIDILRDIRRTDEADRLDVLVVENGIDNFLVAMNDVENARRQAGLQRQFRQPHRHSWIALGRLKNEGVAACDGGCAHPQRDHGRKIEWGYPGNDAKGLACGIDIDPRPGAFGIFTFQQMRNTACKFDDFQPTLYVAF